MHLFLKSKTVSDWIDDEREDVVKELVVDSISVVDVIELE
jgi:hypothetical protein